MEIQGVVRELCLMQIGCHKENYVAVILVFRQERLSFQETAVHCLFVCNTEYFTQLFLKKKKSNLKTEVPIELHS